MTEAARKLKEQADLEKEQINFIIEEVKQEKKLDTRENSMGDMTPPLQEELSGIF